MSPKSKDKSRYVKHTEGDKHTERREGHVNREAEIGVMQPQAKGHLELPEARRGKHRSFSSLQREHGLANTLILNF